MSGYQYIFMKISCESITKLFTTTKNTNDETRAKFLPLSAQVRLSISCLQQLVLEELCKTSL